MASSVSITRVGRRSGRAGAPLEVVTVAKTGEQPGAGLYVCSNCGALIRLEDHDDALPPCPNCEGTEFR
jgi:rubrerythrin